MKDTSPPPKAATHLRDPERPSGDPLWYKDAILYEVHVRAFLDSDGDGIGDFRGLAEKLDYVRDLGATALWLLPFYPSPLRDDGYDIADYVGVHPDYGTLSDFRHLLREAHRRDLRVVTELVLNHTSDRHPWFQRARRAERATRERDFYVWSEARDRYREARILFRDFETSNWSWDPVARAYYWHRFFHHQPDLNYDNPEVRRELFRVLDFWLGMGVDGLRLDAVPYLFEREGTPCENLPETHDFLKELRRHVDSRYRDRVLLAEANLWPEDAASYFGGGDECHMAFHFPLMPRLFMAIRMEDRYPIVDILGQTPAIPDPCQWAIFLRNHDELTLAMVTDEERDYMYRVYAHDPRARINLGIRRRLAPLLENSRRRIELMNGLLFSLPGTPVVYYGDEIGMGDNIYLGDRNGVRTPMQWSADRNAGFSRANAQRLYLPVVIDPDFHYEAVNVEAQQNNPSSLLWWMKRLIALRKRYKALSRGSLDILLPDNRKVLAFVRSHGEERILLVANLSRYAQFVQLDLSPWKGMVPVELFGASRFPRIGDLPYLLTMGPHGFYWFSLERQPAETDSLRGEALRHEPPELRVGGSRDSLFLPSGSEPLERLLAESIAGRRWFAGRARALSSVKLVDAVPLGDKDLGASLALVRAEYREGDPDLYLLPLAFSAGERAEELLASSPAQVLARVVAREGEGILHEGLLDRKVCRALLDAIARRRHLRGVAGRLVATPTSAFRRLHGGSLETLEPVPLRAEQRNSSVQFGDRLILKLFRRVEEGVNPELQVGLFLAERARFPNVPAVAGALEYQPHRGEAMTLAVVHAYAPNEGDAWTFTLDALGRYYERAASLPAPAGQPEALPRPSSLVGADIPPQAREQIGVYLESALLLGRRTAELHAALASAEDDPDFAPETLSPPDQRALFQSMRSQAIEALDSLRRRLGELPAEAQEPARRVLQAERQILDGFRPVVERRITAQRTRIHGDYRLAEVLYTGKDFLIVDFEGDPGVPLSARRIKRSPLRDVAGLLRSFHRAAQAGLQELVSRGGIRREDLPRMEPWARLWVTWVSAAFLTAYVARSRPEALVPGSREEPAWLLDVYLLDKTIHELAQELNGRPERVRLPLQGILDLVRPPER